MQDTVIKREKLIWLDKYSVYVEEIDNQHKKLIEIINNLLDALQAKKRDEQLVLIMNQIFVYKTNHFNTEEKYFHLFNFAGAAEHELAHQYFRNKIREIQERNLQNTMNLAFELVDFLEDWLIDHMLSMDQKYVKCFKDHGLK
jgi:hemerythrin